ncbi:MAG: hypothetical protein ACON36_06630 [Ilumatobacteraceae bacterium]
MIEASAIRRSASAMRTALVGQQTICFSSRKLSGPAPGVGRVIERVECDGREFEFTWDDGLVLHTNLRRSGSWDLYRVGDRWRRKHSDAAALIESEDWVAVCFDAAEVETYRKEPIDRHPSRGRVGPDLSDPDVDREIVVRAILHHSDPSTQIREALLDPRVVRGLGNVYVTEALWATRLSPWARVGDIARSDLIMLVNYASRILNEHLNALGDDGFVNLLPFEVYGRNGHVCNRCGDSIEVTNTPSDSRPLYWCPKCQTRLDWRLLDDTPPGGAQPS